VPLNRRSFFIRLFQFAGLAEAALYSLRAANAGATGAARNSEIINVRAWGALGNGVADDTAAIQASINASSLVYLPPGCYKCTTALVLKKSNFKMYGEGELCFEYDFVGGGITIAAHVDNIELNGFAIRLQSNLKDMGFCGIYSIPNEASVVASRFYNLKIHGAAFGINIGGRQVAELISGIAGKGFKSAGSRVMPYMESSLDGRNIIQGNVIQNSLFSKRIGKGGAHGIYVRGSGYNVISQNQIVNMQGGILAASEGAVANNIILNCFEDNGIYCAGSVGLSVHANFIENTKADGIAFNHAENCSAIGNQVTGAGNASFRIQESHGIVISANVCNSKGVSGSYVRSFSDKGSPDAPHNILIENNLFAGGIVKGNAFAFGMLPIGAAYKNWRISGNQIVGVNSSSLSESFFGPHAIVMFAAHKENSNLIVENNTFSEITRCMNGPLHCQLIKNATRESGNDFEYSE